MMKYRLEFDLVNFCNRRGHRTDKLARFSKETVRAIFNQVARRLAYDDSLVLGSNSYFEHESKQFADELKKS